MCQISVKCIAVSIHWTLLSNFNFLHYSQILHCLKTIAKLRNMHARLFALCSHACIYYSTSAKIIVSIHWNLLGDFHFLHHRQILDCLKAIDKYRDVHAHLCALCLHVCMYCSRRVKIVVSIHWTLLSNFHHPQIVHCLTAITKSRNVHACLCALRSHACTYHSKHFLSASLIPLW